MKVTLTIGTVTACIDFDAAEAVRLLAAISGSEPPHTTEHPSPTTEETPAQEHREETKPEPSRLNRMKGHTNHKRPCVATLPNGSKRYFDSIREACTVLGLKYTNVSKAIQTGALVDKKWRFAYTGGQTDTDIVSATPEPEPTPAPEPEEQPDTDAPDLREPSARGKVSVGEAIKAIKKLQRATNVKPVVGYHKSGEIKYFPSVALASQYCSVSVSTIYNNVNTNRVTPNGWRFEYDETGEYRISKRKGGTA